MDFDKRKDELVELAFIDQSADWEVDMFGIYFDEKTGKFCYLAASGCSCWDGYYQEEEYNSLEELADALNARSGGYSPSIKGENFLVEEARKNWLNMQELATAKIC